MLLLGLKLCDVEEHHSSPVNLPETEWQRRHCVLVRDLIHLAPLSMATGRAAGILSAAFQEIEKVNQ